MAIQAQFPYCGSQDWMDYGCGGFNQFNLQQQKQEQQQCNMHQLQNQNLFFDGSPVSSSSPLKSNNCNAGNLHLSMSPMASFDEKQRQEIDHYIRLQNERLRLLLQEQKRRQFALLLKKVESGALPLLKQKDQEIAQATKRTMELEDFLRKLEFESQTWQRIAHENEAVVVSLNNTIEQLKENASSCCNNDAEDAESCCDIGREEEGEGEGFADDDIAKKMAMMVCEGCNSRKSCILFLPCRHLCSCKACEGYLDSCPVCLTPKKASIEALMV